MWRAASQLTMLFMNTSMNTHLAIANEHEIVRRVDGKRRRWLGRR